MDRYTDLMEEPPADCGEPKSKFTNTNKESNLRERWPPIYVLIETEEHTMRIALLGRRRLPSYVA